MPFPARDTLIESSPPHASNPAGGTFIVRVWMEALGGEQTEWRGRVQDVSNGQVTFFQGWEHLSTTILDMLANQNCDARDALENDLST